MQERERAGVLIGGEKGITCRDVERGHDSNPDKVDPCASRRATGRHI